MSAQRLVGLGPLSGSGAVWVAPADGVAALHLLWDGYPPPPTPPHSNLPSPGLKGQISGRAVYTEVLPPGILLGDRRPPLDLMPGIVQALLQALVVLRASGQTHGLLGPDRVFIGDDGEMLLVGRGRATALPSLDVLRAMALCTEDERTIPGNDPALLVELLQDRVPPDHRTRLAAWARAQPHLEIPPNAQELVLDPASEALGEAELADEVLVDLGPDTGGEGLFDSWDPSEIAENPEDVTLWGEDRTPWKAPPRPPLKPARPTEHEPLTLVERALLGSALLYSLALLGWLSAI